jgi:transposase InsO family protein
MAIGQRQPKPGLLHHSDRGSQYASAEYQRQLWTAKMVCSMSRKGNCYENAVVERVFRSLKEEGFTDEPPATRADDTLSVLDCFIIVSAAPLNPGLLEPQYV